jgi:hypothetical protein
MISNTNGQHGIPLWSFLATYSGNIGSSYSKTKKITKSALLLGSYKDIGF